MNLKEIEKSFLGACMLLVWSAFLTLVMYVLEVVFHNIPVIGPMFLPYERTFQDYINFYVGVVWGTVAFFFMVSFTGFQIVSTNEDDQEHDD